VQAVGDVASDQTTVSELRLWSQDNFGEDLGYKP
jgi:hypothetical protein